MNMTWIVAASVLLAKDPVEPVNRDKGSIAIKGYDPVAYHEQSKPMKGSPEFHAELERRNLKDRLHQDSRPVHDGPKVCTAV